MFDYQPVGKLWVTSRLYSVQNRQLRALTQYIEIVEI